MPGGYSARTEHRSAHRIIEVAYLGDTVDHGRKGMPMIDHVVLGVHHVDESRHFYEHALAPLGLKVVRNEPELIDFGDDTGRPFFWLTLSEPTHRVHVAFT